MRDHGEPQAAIGFVPRRVAHRTRGNPRTSDPTPGCPLGQDGGPDSAREESHGGGPWSHRGAAPLVPTKGDVPCRPPSAPSPLAGSPGHALPAGRCQDSLLRSWWPSAEPTCPPTPRPRGHGGPSTRALAPEKAPQPGRHLLPGRRPRRARPHLPAPGATSPAPIRSLGPAGARPSDGGGALYYDVTGGGATGSDRPPDGRRPDGRSRRGW